MGDDAAAPYDKAIEETAKATGKAIDLVRDGAGAVSGPISTIYGLIIGDRMEAARERNLDAITRKTKKILAARDLAETAAVAEQIGIPLLEAARGETRDEMQDLWAQLLANAMDPSRRDDVRADFISTLRSLHPIDAVALRCLYERFQNAFVNSPEQLGLPLRATAVGVSLDHLSIHRCLDASSQHTYILNAYGTELVVACTT